MTTVTVAGEPIFFMTKRTKEEWGSDKTDNGEPIRVLWTLDSATLTVKKKLCNIHTISGDVTFVQVDEDLYVSLDTSGYNSFEYFRFSGFQKA